MYILFIKKKLLREKSPNMCFIVFYFELNFMKNTYFNKSVRGLTAKT